MCVTATATLTSERPDTAAAVDILTRNGFYRRFAVVIFKGDRPSRIADEYQLADSAQQMVGQINDLLAGTAKSRVLFQNAEMTAQRHEILSAAGKL